eukprot:tig00000361_g24424.t1
MHAGPPALSAQGLQLSLQRAISRVKPWGEFFGPVSTPASSEWVQRVTANARYFKSNYLIVILASFAWTVLTRPLFLLAFICIGIGWGYFLRIKDETLVIGGQELTIQHKYGIFITATAFILALTSFLETAVWCILFGGTLSFVHATLRTLSPFLKREERPSLV